MMHVASLLFTPLSASSFRWQGEFGPQARGPQAYAESAYLPLPSTTAGLLAGLALHVSGHSLCVDCGDQYCNVRRGLRLIGGALRLRGPFIYVELVGRDSGYALCVPYGRRGMQSIYCVSSDAEGRIISPRKTQRTGIALDMLAKTAMEGYIYTGILVDLALIADHVAHAFGGRPGAHGILVELHADGGVDRGILGRLDGLSVNLGGEQRPARIKVMEGAAPAAALASRILGECKDGCCYWHIATPILLCGLPGTRSTAEDLLGLVTPRSLSLCSGGTAEERIYFSALGMGYDMCREARRGYCRAVMPGAGLLLRPGGAAQIKVYMDGMGRYSDLGWGTLIPLPRPALRPCRQG